MTIISSIEARDIINIKWKSDFFHTPYQLACQLGLYYEESNYYYPRFTTPPTLKEINIYLKEWLNNYYVPNPYTKKGFDNIQPFIIHSKLCEMLLDAKSDINWEDVKNKIFGETIGNDDILRNTIEYYSEVVHIKNGILMLKEGIEYSDLQAYIKPIITKDRNNKVQFFNHFNTNFTVRESLGVKYENTIFYGSPGTGKSYRVNEILKDLDKNFYERITFHPEYDHSSFVGSYKPKSVVNEKNESEIQYIFVPQAFTNIYVRAWKDLTNQYYLAIEEINRGNCAEIFGDIFQLLDRDSNYTVSPSEELEEYLVKELGKSNEGISNGLKLPSNLSLLATMNTSDQSLFPMDSAFRRRWDWEYVPICYDEGEENKSSTYIVKIDKNRSFRWLDFIKTVNLKIKQNDNLGMDKCIGNYFIKPSKDEITLKEFINKAIFYLWNDVFKDEEENDSIFLKGTYYEDFFPIETNGLDETIKILSNLSITITSTLNLDTTPTQITESKKDESSD